MMWPALVVLDAESVVAPALEQLASYADAARLVLRRRLGPATFWYVATVGAVRERAGGAGAAATLVELLGLDGMAPSETWQAAAGEPPDEPRPLLVLDGDRVAGLADEATARAPRRVEDDDEAGWDGRASVGFRSTAATRPARQAFEVVRVFYGTDRKPVGNAAIAPFYGGERGAQLSLGLAEVSIPSRHRQGTVERPVWWRFEWREDPARHVVVLRVDALEREGFVGGLRACLEQADRKDVLLFVHGYNVRFDDAVRRTAQLAYDLRPGNDPEFPGVPLLYSWPSQGEVHTYMTDETNVGWTLPHFEEFLRVALADSGATTVHVIAHSMGNRALLDLLRTFDAATLPAGSATLGQVVLAAPDVDADVFRQLAAALTGRAERFTLYASSNDLALKASRELRSGLPRAGESGEHLVVVSGVDTIDASAVDTSLLGHSYYGERTLLGDLFYLLRERKPPGERYGLAERLRAGDVYWEFVP